MSFAVLAVLAAVWSIGPGLWVVRRFDWDPLEKLCAATALSYLMLFLWFWGGALTGFLPAAASVWTLAALGMTMAVRKDAAALWRDPRLRTGVSGWAALLLWSLLLQLVVRHYGGADWSGDWYEHYQRSVFFTLWPFDTGFLFLDRYLLPARPPLMNVVAAGTMSLVGTAFAGFQVVMTFLNSLIYLPLLALTRVFGGGDRRTPWILAMLLALSPMFCQNVTYTWTRLFAGFFVVLALVLYIEAWRGGDSAGMVAAFTFLAAGFLVHFSAGPYLVVLAGHYLAFLWRRRRGRGRELAAIVVTGVVILGSWFGWSLGAFGVRGTFGTNTTVTDSSNRSPGENVVKVLFNIERTIVPFVVHGGLPLDGREVSSAVTVRSTAFLLYQNNLVFAFGSLAWIVVGILLIRGWREGRTGERPPPRAFWAWGIVLVVVLGIAVVGGPVDQGLAHICLQPLVLMLLAFAAARLTGLRPALRTVILVGAVIDFVFGIVLHFLLLHRDLPAGLGTVEAFNLQIKHRVGLVFLGDVGSSWATAVIGAMIAGGVVMLLAAAVVTRGGPAGSESSATTEIGDTSGVR